LATGSDGGGVQNYEITSLIQINSSIDYSFSSILLLYIHLLKVKYHSFLIIDKQLVGEGIGLEHKYEILTA